MQDRAKINLNHGDCMAAMTKMDDNAYDLAIVDPPYGIGDINQGRSRKIHKKMRWNNSIPTARYFRELQRVSKNQIIWGINYYAKFISCTGRIIHDKTGGNRNQQLKELSDVDLASHSFGVNLKIFHYIWQGNAQGNTINWKNSGTDRRIHPTQKPVALYKWLLANYAKPNNKILDTHGGSMSIAIACWDLKHDLDLWELDKDYYDAGKKRFENYAKQGQFNF